MNKFTELKNKVTTYLDEHPGIKKGLKIGFALLGVGVTAYAGYKIGEVSNKVSVPEVPKDPDTMFRPITDPLPLAGDIWTSDRHDIPLVEDKHSFDMTFTDLTTGDKYIAKDSCLGYYVNDVLGSFEDTPIQIVTENPVKEIAETAVDIVESTQDA